MTSSETIPNNVDLKSDRRLQRALEKWHPKFIDWWRSTGPDGFQDHHQVYLRTAISTDKDGWAQFGHVKLPEYRWGIFLAKPRPGRTIGFGDMAGQPVWNEVPGEFRNTLRNLIVTQGDTEPASVEQQRMLGGNCPSLYDLRNLFQVNVEEGRHLWAMVYLLHSYFGRDGREEAEGLLERRSGDADKPRILNAFNAPITNWLDFFMFTTFTDRDGKYQLLSLAESSLEPLSLTTRFMLTEEAHHMFVGETGVGRVVERAAEILKQSKGVAEDVRKGGGVDLPTIQKFLNLWYSLSLDLFGSEISSNAASYFATGLKGRAHEEKYDDHVALDGTYEMDLYENGAFRTESVPMRNAMNEVLRDAYSSDCARAVERWNKILEKHGIPDRLKLPSRRFHRTIGLFKDAQFDLDGSPLSDEEWQRRRGEFLPSAEDREYLESLQAKATYAPGKMSNWIAPPAKGINGQPVDFEYVRAEA